MNNKMKWGLLMAPLVALCAGQAFAQEEPDRIGQPILSQSGSVSGLPVDLLPPGARALGIGGAFTAVADDSTAALANPAGLTNLTAPEVSVYGRYTDADVRYLDPDAYTSALNANKGEVDKLYSDSSTDISFASFVMPMDGVVFSLFYSNQLNFEGVQETPDVYRDTIVRSAEGFPDFQYLDEYTNENYVSSKVENIGLSAAFRLNDKLSLGVTARYTKLRLRNADIWQLDWWNDWETDMADIFYSDVNNGGFATMEQVQSFLPVINDIYNYSTAINDSKTDLNLDVGLFYKGDQWSFGAVYHPGSKFTFQALGSVASEFSCNTVSDESMTALCQDFSDALDVTGLREQIYPNGDSVNDVVVKLPSVVSLGAAFRPTDTWLISVDVNRVNYSVLNGPRSITLGFNLDINQAALAGDYFDTTIPQVPITEEIDDAWQFHVGAEKSFFFDSGPLRNLALRAGAFTVEDHDGIVATDNDETVWTLGVGTIWGKNEIGAKLFQVDLGASFADDVTNVVLSGIFRF